MGVNRLSRELLRSLKEVEKNLGRPVFTWAGNNYACSPNQATASKTLGLGGFALSADLTLFVRVEVLPPVGPKEKQILTYSGKRYRIDLVATLPGNEVLSLACNDASQGV